MVTVTCYSNDKVASVAECDVEAVVFTARVLWDEAFNGLYGQQRSLVIEAGDDTYRMEVRP